MVAAVVWTAYAPSAHAAAVTVGVAGRTALASGTPTSQHAARAAISAAGARASLAPSSRTAARCAVTVAST